MMGMTDKQAIADAYALGYAEGFANADEIFDLNEDDMEEHGWVRAERLKYREVAKENEERLLEDTLRSTIRDLEDEVNWLHAELHGAETEAKKLRGMLGCPLLEVGKRARQNGKRLPCERLMERNTELRELVRDMYKAFMHGNCYRWCEFKEPCNYITDGKCQWYERMRELGVEE